MRGLKLPPDAWDVRCGAVALVQLLLLLSLFVFFFVLRVCVWVREGRGKGGVTHSRRETPEHHRARDRHTISRKSTGENKRFRGEAV